MELFMQCSTTRHTTQTSLASVRESVSSCCGRGTSGSASGGGPDSVTGRATYLVIFWGYVPLWHLASIANFLSFHKIQVFFSAVITYSMIQSIHFFFLYALIWFYCTSEVEKNSNILFEIRQIYKLQLFFKVFNWTNLLNPTSS